MFIRAMLLSFIILFTNVINGLAQSVGIDDFASQLAKHSTIEDLNERKYQLSKFNEGFMNWLQNNEVEVAGLKAGALKCVVSDDHLYTIFYYYQIQPTGVLFEIFVKYKDERDHMQAHHFSENVSLKVKAMEKLKAPEIRLSPYLQNGIKFQEASFGESENPLPWYKYSDLKMKCLFEEIGLAKDDSVKLTINSILLKRLKSIWETPEAFDDDLRVLIG